MFQKMDRLAESELRRLLLVVEENEASRPVRQPIGRRR